jgi:hypothetical protein
MFGDLFGGLFGSGPALNQQELSKNVDLSQFSTLALLKLYWQILDEEHEERSKIPGRPEMLEFSIKQKNSELRLTQLTINNPDMISPSIWCKRVEVEDTTFQLVQRYKLKSECSSKRNGFFVQEENGPDHEELMDPRKDDCEEIILGAIREAVKPKILPYFFANFIAKQITWDLSQRLELMRLQAQKPI